MNLDRVIDELKTKQDLLSFSRRIFTDHNLIRQV